MIDVTAHLRALGQWIDDRMNDDEADVDLHYVLEDVGRELDKLVNEVETAMPDRPTILETGSHSFDVQGRLR